ncbi:MAG: CDP-alcohol phosphatidyltransferase family protein [Candidatus Peribacteraceae bacterium]|nr:CDP-alcohol phosphatidyltransferase family protein [Candidatus Peribacteraceae bacterium]
MAIDVRAYNIYSEQEAPYMRWFQHVREKIFAPFLRLCQWLGVGPFTLSLLSLFSMVLLPVGLHQGRPVLVLLAFVLHMFFDGTDGALARRLGQTSVRGAYVDVVVDHLALIITVLSLQWFGIGSPFWVMLYAASYLLLVVHLLILNIRGTPPSIPVIRSRYLMFLAVVLLQFGVLEIGWFELFFQVAGIYHGGIMITYFFLLGWSLPS